LGAAYLIIEGIQSLRAVEKHIIFQIVQPKCGFKFEFNDGANSFDGRQFRGFQKKGK
jgi:hypothetical protein